MSTLPSPDAPTPRAGRTRLITIVVVSALLLVVVLVLVAGRVVASNRLDAYEEAFRTWNDNDRNTFVSVATDLPEGLYDSDDSDEVFARQREACAEMVDLRAEIDDRSASMPVVTAGAWGVFSGDLRDAAHASERRADELRTARVTASDAFDQIRVDCRWNIDQNIDRRLEQAADLESRAEKLSDPEGASDTSCSGGSCTTYTCTSPDGCLPLGADDLRRSGELQLEADQLRGAVDQKFLGEDQCGWTSYGPLCATLKKRIKTVNDASQRYDRVVRDGADDGELADAIEARADAVDDLTDAFGDALKSELPELARRDGSLAGEPGNNDLFLLRASDLLMADVEAAMKPVAAW